MPEIYFPGSDQPFRPVNPWGRPVPKVHRPEREPLYQLVVRRKGREIPFGPKAGKVFVAELCRTIEAGIRVGVEKELTEPHIVKVL